MLMRKLLTGYTKDLFERMKQHERVKGHDTLNRTSQKGWLMWTFDSRSKPLTREANKEAKPSAKT